VSADTARRALRYCSYTHSVVYATLLWAAFTDHEDVVSVLGWVHGVGWIVMSALCIEAVRRRIIPLWLGVTVAVVGGVGPFAGSVGFYVDARRRKGYAQPPEWRSTQR
jgi:hypothetical protein